MMKTYGFRRAAAISTSPRANSMPTWISHFGAIPSDFLVHSLASCEVAPKRRFAVHLQFRFAAHFRLLPGTGSPRLRGCAYFTIFRQCRVEAKATRSGLRAFHLVAAAYASSSTGSHHSFEVSVPGTSSAMCWNQLSGAAPCQCLTLAGMFTVSPFLSRRTGLPHS